MERVQVDPADAFLKFAFRNLNLAILLCAMLFALSFSASAQEQPKLRKIGWLGTRPASGPDSGIEVIRRELRALGWVEGKNITFEHRYTEGKLERLPVLAEELVRLESRPNLHIHVAGCASCQERYLYDYSHRFLNHR